METDAILALCVSLLLRNCTRRFCKAAKMVKQVKNWSFANCKRNQLYRGSLCAEFENKPVSVVTIEGAAGQDWAAPDSRGPDKSCCTCYTLLISFWKSKADPVQMLLSMAKSWRMDSAMVLPWSRNKVDVASKLCKYDWLQGRDRSQQVPELTIPGCKQIRSCNLQKTVCNKLAY